MTKLVLTRGLPASGKSTHARAWVDVDPQWRSRVNRDDLRFQTSGMYVFPDGSRRMLEETVTLLQHSMVRTLLMAKRDVIVDDTNLAARFVKEWLKLAREVGAEVEFVDFNTPVDECVQRDKRRGLGGDRTVGEDVIRSFASRYLRKGKLPQTPTLESAAEVRRVYERPNSGLTAYLVDIDGTLARMTGRGPFEWTRVGEDEPIEDVIRLVKTIMLSEVADVIFMSGRDEVSRAQTTAWLRTHVTYGETPELYMRAEGDMRRDSIVKHELFYKHVADRYDVVGVIDDRQQVVDMWREIGLTVFQCARGDF